MGAFTASDSRNKHDEVSHRGLPCCLCRSAVWTLIWSIPSFNLQLPCPLLQGTSLCCLYWFWPQVLCQLWWSCSHREACADAEPEADADATADADADAALYGYSYGYHPRVYS